MIFFAPRRRIAMPPEDLSVTVGGREVPVAIRRNARARRLILRIDPDGCGVTVTVPSVVRLDDAISFVRGRTDWIADRLDSIPAPIALSDGADVPVLGVAHRVRHDPNAHAVSQRDGEIVVVGRAEHLSRRLRDWFRREARREIAPRVAAKAAQLGRKPGRITIRDTRSRWGSCSVAGNLSFCWRLVMAPEAVLDYVVAHEVAHLAERGHGPAFWRTVEGLTDDVATAKAWLRREGPDLHRYG